MQAGTNWGRLYRAAPLNATTPFGDHQMPFDGTSLPCDPAESSAELLATADRVRRHVWMFTGDLAERRLEQLADELEAKARQIGRPRI
jgi:hypothetical protein